MSSWASSFIDSGLSYRAFVAHLSLMPQVLERLGLARPPSYSILQQALRRLDTRLLHRMYRLLGRARPPPRTVAVDYIPLASPTPQEGSGCRCGSKRR
ncbi:MAG: hypothetical protein K9W43_07040 [Candidatus Thorarchaeota archaeon]|nr:hypothetical protein [Candidatus Thorarchaeota archaeon]